MSAICHGFVNTPLVPSEAQEFVTAMGMPVIEPSRVAEAAMQAIDAKVNGSEWIVRGDVIRRHDPAPIELT